MKKLAINIKYWAKSTALILGLSAAVSCDGFLEEDVISNIGNDYLNTPKGMNDGINAAYSSMRAWYGTERGNNLTIFGTDIFTNGADGSYKFMNTYTNQFDSRVNHLQELWDEFYRGINTCNAVIDRSANITGISQEIVARRVAEAKFELTTISSWFSYLEELIYSSQKPFYLPKKSQGRQYPKFILL